MRWKKYFNNCKTAYCIQIAFWRCSSQEDHLFIKILIIKNQQISRCLHVVNAIYYNIWVFEINQIHFLLNNLTTYRQSLPHSTPPPPDHGLNKIALHYLGMLPHQLQFVWPIGVLKENIKRFFPYVFLCKNVTPQWWPHLTQKVHLFDERESKLPEVLPSKLHLVWPVDFGEDNFKRFYSAIIFMWKFNPNISST